MQGLSALLLAGGLAAAFAAAPGPMAAGGAIDLAGGTAVGERGDGLRVGHGERLADYGRRGFNRYRPFGYDRYGRNRAGHHEDDGQVAVAPDAGRSVPRASGPCREFTTTMTFDGRPRERYGTVCRLPDGSWKILE